MARSWFAILCTVVVPGWFLLWDTSVEAEPMRYVRCEVEGRAFYGVVREDPQQGTVVQRLEGDLFASPRPVEETFPLSQVRLLVPCQPAQVFAMAGNYRSHLGGENVTATITSTTTVTTDLQTGATVVATTTDNDVRRPGEIPAKFRTPQPFLKPTACLTPHLSEIRLPNDAGPVHYEAEMVLVIGKRASDVSPQEARDHIFGITCGNDVSARQWQKNDIQWWRAKGADTFGPVGPWIVTGLNDADRTLRLRLNGQLRQEAKTSELIHGAAEIVSFISRHTTLFPGDLIFTGTPGSTDVLAPGDVVEVELEGVGTLRNTVVSED